MNKILLLFIFLSLTACNQKDIAQTDIVKREYLIQLLENPPTNKVQVINFWATWCEPCVEELPAFIELDDNENIEVILISLDDARSVDSLVNPFLKKQKITATVKLLDDPYAAEWIPMVDQHWDGAIPATLIQKGSKKMFYNKTFTAAELSEEIAKFL
jgi:thiol-disulfide isomerase/thioredoxin